jgi:hypothetical protein
MHTRSPSFRRSLSTFLLLGTLLAAVWPAAVSSQGPGLSEEVARFRKERTRTPAPFPRFPGPPLAALTGTEDASQGLRLWRKETLVTGLDNSAMPSLQIDNDGRPHIAYFHYMYQDSDLEYASLDGMGWHTETVDSAGDVGAEPSLAFDSAGRPHIAYKGYNQHTLKHAWFDGAAWQMENVTQGAFDPSLALDAAGRPHIAFYSASPDFDLKFAYNDGLSWHIQTVDSDGISCRISLALGSQGFPHVSYYDWTSPGTLKYAYYDGTNWHVELVDGEANQTSLELDSADQPHIAYWGDVEVKHAWRSGGLWRTEGVDLRGDGESASLALDSAGRPHISYCDDFYGELRYAYYDGTVWHTELVDQFSWGECDTSLALDDSGAAHIAYSGGGELRYAVFASDPNEWSSLAFSSYRDWQTLSWEVYTARPDGANQARRSDHRRVDYLPEFNRGADEIVFVSNRDGNNEIYRMKADGSQQTRLTWTSAGEYLPTWAPDGSRVAFYSYRDGDAEIYTMDADGSNQTRLTFHPAWDGHPTWSPDGSRIAFISDRGGEDALWVMDADGSNQQQLASGFNYAAYPDWSPDGSRIALNDDFNNDGWFDLAIINADGTGLVHPLGASPTNHDRSAPVWAPHGEDLLFSRVQWIVHSGNWYWLDAYLYRLNLATKETYQVVDAGLEWWPDWQPTDVSAPFSQVDALPVWSGGTFTVTWSGGDTGGAGLRSYEVQYRDGPSGGWTDWLQDTAQTAAVFTGGQNGHTYYFRSRARDFAYNVEPYPPGDGDAFTTVDLTPPSSQASSPEYADEPTFRVTWSGTDAGAGIASYDVQYRDGTSGAWTDWLVGVEGTGASFPGELGHTYYFQCRGRDAAGNVEAYPGGDGDTFTHTPQYGLLGYVLGNRDQPVAFATVVAIPPALNTALSGYRGDFGLYFNDLGARAVEASRDGFGTLPPMKGISVENPPPVTFYLPPVDDAVVDGGFEAGDLAAWQSSGEIAPVVTGTAHTGDYAATLGGAAPPPVVTPTAPFSASAVLDEGGGVLTSAKVTVTVPVDAVSGTVTFTLSSVPLVAGVPEIAQDVGPHFSLTARLTDGTPLTMTLLPLTLTVRYDDAAWEAAQIVGEETLSLWWYDPEGGAWMQLGGEVDAAGNTVTVQTPHLGPFALLGDPYPGPWGSVLEQEIALPPGLVSGTLSLLYRLEGVEHPSDTLLVAMEGATEVVSYTLPLTAGVWLHRWWEVPSWAGPTLTLRLEWMQEERERPAGVIVDEVSLGTAARGAFLIYLPIVLRGQ